MQLIYQLALIFGAVVNLLMAALLSRRNRDYRPYPNYLRARRFMELWLTVFAIGYLIHAFVRLRYFWPTAAAALTVTYFHLGAICFCWGFIPLLKPDYLTRKILIRDTLIYVAGLVCYWGTAFITRETSVLTRLPYLIFFVFCACNAVVFYRIYDQVTFRLIVMAHGDVTDFVRWLQASCDIIIFFGIFLVAVTIIFPNAASYLTPVETFMGTFLFGYIAHCVSRYGRTIAAATKATEDVNC